MGGSAFGALFSSALAEVPLKTVVWAFGLGGVLTYVGVHVLLARPECEVTFALVLALALAALVVERSRTTYALALGIVVLSGGEAYEGWYDPKGLLLQSVEARDVTPA